ncbi:Os11g0652750 [Oryza sativa Japonica Group]|uniref:Os11g0652750 protein n=1 Tax=Oryza sativa subsp. japonica TaxID=39947 RepID=A0A0P0Y4U7_ORYSJ|nr:Os11g0652750 [Oryza sativa Japonica Group]
MPPPHHAAFDSAPSCHRRLRTTAPPTPPHHPSPPLLFTAPNPVGRAVDSTHGAADDSAPLPPPVAISLFLRMARGARESSQRGRGGER